MSKATTLVAPRKTRDRKVKGPWLHRGTARWCIKKAGRTHYLSKLADDPDGDLARLEWDRIRIDVENGRPIRPAHDELDVAGLVNRWLSWKRSLVDRGELQLATWKRLHQICAVVVKEFGRNRAVSTLGPADFESLAVTFGKKWGLETRVVNTQIARSLFKYAADTELIARSLNFGPAFKRPPSDTLRRHRADKADRELSPAQLRKLLAAASPMLKGAILLGINAAYGPRDCCGLEIHHIGDDGTLCVRRIKTGAQRQAWLWNETRAALAAAVAARPKIKDAADASALFINAKGQRCNRSQLGKAFSKLAKQVGIECTIYDLRRSFATVADEAGDPAAVSRVMGHVAGSGDMLERYRQRGKRLPAERIKRVCEFVHGWLYKKEK